MAAKNIFRRPEISFIHRAHSSAHHHRICRVQTRKRLAQAAAGQQIQIAPPHIGSGRTRPFPHRAPQGIMLQTVIRNNRFDFGVRRRQRFAGFGAAAARRWARRLAVKQQRLVARFGGGAALLKRMRTAAFAPVATADDAHLMPCACRDRAPAPPSHHAAFAGAAGMDIAHHRHRHRQLSLSDGLCDTDNGARHRIA